MTKILEGNIVSIISDKTVKVLFQIKKQDSKYKKFTNRKIIFMCHNEGLDLKKNDRVVIKESRPISKRKNWIVVSKI